MEAKSGPEIRSKILSIMRIKGPCLPVHIGREINMNTMFASAFLSELAGDKEIKISNMKVGGSPLYYIPGHELQLERFSNYLSGKEKEAFLLIKDNKILEDTKLEPAIRVAIRGMKDFAHPLILNVSEGQRTFWRYLSLTEDDAKKLVEEIVTKEKPFIKETPVSSPALEAQKIPVKPSLEKPLLELEEPFQKPVSLEKSRQERKPKDIASETPILELKLLPASLSPKPNTPERTLFASQAIALLDSKNIEVLEDKDIQKKDYSAIVRLNSDIGKLKLLAVCKNKKRLNEQDIIQALQKSQELKLPLLLCAPSLDKKAEAYAKNYSGWLTFFPLKL